MSAEKNRIEAQSAAPAGAAAAATPIDDLAFVADVPVKLHVELGEATLSIAELMRCGNGSVITLDKRIGEPFLITLNGRPVAEGEVVEDGANLGIRITNVLAGGISKETMGQQ